MQNRSNRPACPTPPFQEPEMRRWPHPVACAPGEGADDAGVPFLRRALSYQNQLLADIKALLEQLVTDTRGENVEK